MAALSTREKERKEMKIGCISICRYMAPHWDLKASDIILKERVSVTGPNLEQSVPKRTLLILRWFDFYKVFRIFTKMKKSDKYFSKVKWSMFWIICLKCKASLCFHVMWSGKTSRREQIWNVPVMAHDEIEIIFWIHNSWPVCS